MFFMVFEGQPPADYKCRSGCGPLPSCASFPPSAGQAFQGPRLLPAPAATRCRPDVRKWRSNAACRFVFLRSEEHTSELQSLTNLVCRLLLEKKKKKQNN